MKDNMSVAHAWAHGRDANGLNLHSRGGDLDSYYTTIATRFEVDGKIFFVVDTSSYSVTTNRHQSCALGAVPIGAIKLEIPLRRVCESFYQKLSCEDVVRIIMRHYMERLQAALGGFEESVSMKTEKEFDWLPLWGRITEFASELNVSISAVMPNENVCKAFTPESDGFYNTPCLPDVVDAALGEGAYLKYVCRTLPQRRREATRRGEKFSMPEGISDDIWADSQSMLAFAKEQRAQYLAAEKARKLAEIERLRKDFERAKEKFLSAGESIWYWHHFPNELFDGGNVLLRVNWEKERVETSKGIKLTFDEARRMWGVAKRLRDKIQILSGEADVRSLNGRFPFREFKKNILTIGCHEIAFSEIEHIAKEMQIA